jgi:hypothetical protein
MGRPISKEEAVQMGLLTAMQRVQEAFSNVDGALIELRPTAIPTTHIASGAAPKSWLFMAMIPSRPGR